MSRNFLARIFGKANAVATAETEARVDTSGGLNVGGHVPHDDADVGNPVKIGFQGRTSLPAAAANSDRVNGIADKFGRQVVYPFTVRDLIATGYATLTRSQEASVIPAAAGSYMDLVQITGTNLSSVAVPVIIRNILAGNIIDQLEIPPTSTITRDYTIPYPASETGNVLSAQVNVADQSDSPVTVAMLAVKNV